MTLQRNKPRRLKNTGRHKSNVGLFSNPPIRHHQMSRLRHDIAHPQRRLLPLDLQHTKPSRRSVLLGKRIPKKETLNGSIFNVAAVIKNVVASAAESEVGACFHNSQSGAPLRVTLTDDIVNETIKQKRSKAMDMRYHWLTNRVRRKTIRRLLAPRT
jgi:hypothetical protein